MNRGIGGLGTYNSSGVPFTDEERREFRQLLRSDPTLRRLYKAFKSESAQAVRDQVGQDPFLSRELDALFEIAMISGE